MFFAYLLQFKVPDKPSVDYALCSDIYCHYILGLRFYIYTKFISVYGAFELLRRNLEKTHFFQFLKCSL